jgi:hypothetical protein
VQGTRYTSEVISVRACFGIRSPRSWNIYTQYVEMQSCMILALTRTQVMEFVQVGAVFTLGFLL